MSQLQKQLSVNPRTSVGKVFDTSKYEGFLEDFSSRNQNKRADEIQHDILSQVQEHELRRYINTGKLTLVQQVFDISVELLNDASQELVDDTFWRCFQETDPEPWNWNLYLFPMWCCGVIIRYLILFPLRLLTLLAGFILFSLVFFPIHYLVPAGDRRKNIEKSLISALCCVFIASWTGVIKYHGPKPVHLPNRVFVANHTSMIDYIILSAIQPFSAIMQQYPGWVGFTQTNILDCLGCLWFNRNQVADRKLVQQNMKKHISSGSSCPLLVFPEGVCVNNEYCVMFKRGAFTLGATVCPVAIKYNKLFVDAHWNSRKFSFTQHLAKLMVSWAVVCDVYFLEPQTQQQDESSDQFSNRIQKMIADKAGLKSVPWDGYLKYYILSEKHPQYVEERRAVIAQAITKSLTEAKEVAKAQIDENSEDKIKAFNADKENGQ